MNCKEVLAWPLRTRQGQTLIFRKKFIAFKANCCFFWWHYSGQNLESICRWRDSRFGIYL